MFFSIVLLLCRGTQHFTKKYLHPEAQLRSMRKNDGSDLADFLTDLFGVMNTEDDEGKVARPWQASLTSTGLLIFNRWRCCYLASRFKARRLLW